MRFIFLNLFLITVGLSKNDTILNNLSQFNIEDNIEHLVINNVGDPIVKLIPTFLSTSPIIEHNSRNARAIDFKNHVIFNDDYSTIKYENTYNEGAYINALLSRRINNNTRLYFNYGNLSSRGFYDNQLNKYSNLVLKLVQKYNKRPYHYMLSFNSLNASYEMNGGLTDFYSGSSNELSPTYIQNGLCSVKKRQFIFKQNYNFSKSIKIIHRLDFTSFKRSYEDDYPSSFYYSLTPYYYAIINYNLQTFYDRIYNSFSLKYRESKISISKLSYFTNNLNSNKINGDIYVSFQNNNFLTDNLCLNTTVFTNGYNKSNFIYFVGYKKITDKLSYDFKINYVKKKPNFFAYQYYNGNPSSWDNFNISSLFSTNVFLSNINENFSSSLYFASAENYTYYDELASISQIENKINYFKINIKKNLIFKNFRFESDLIYQNIDNNQISIPNLVFSQKISFKKKIINNYLLKLSIRGLLLSRYYPDNFFPLTDVFYQQREVRSSKSPFVSGDILISRSNFSFGFSFDHLNTFIDKKSFLTPFYIYPNPVARIVIKITFLN